MGLDKDHHREYFKEDVSIIDELMRDTHLCDDIYFYISRVSLIFLSHMCMYMCSVFSAKAVIIGDANTGKTTLTHRYVDGVFSANYKTTVGVDIATKEYYILNRKFLLHIVDTAGQERFRSVSRTYYRNAHVILLSFDLSSMNSLENTRFWFQEATQENQDHVYYVFLVGCKRDITRTVNLEDVLTYAKSFNAEYVEISSKTCKLFSVLG